MLSKPGFEIPYYSDKPLSKDSTWMVFPVEVKVKDKEYGAGLEKGKALISQLEDMTISLAKDKCDISHPIIKSNDLSIETLVEFKKNNSECISMIYHPIVICFFENTEFWKKMEIATIFLDAISEFCSKLDKNKLASAKLNISSVSSNKYSLG